RFACGPALDQQALEAVGVQLVGLGPQDVPRGSGHQERAGRPPCSRRLEGLAQLPNVDLKRVCGGPRWLRPQLFDQPIAGDELFRIDQQDREQGSLLPCTQRHLSPFMAHLERPQDLKLHCSLPTRKLAPASNTSSPRGGSPRRRAGFPAFSAASASTCTLWFVLGTRKENGMRTSTITTMTAA